MDFIFQDDIDLSKEGYLDVVSRRAKVGFTTEMGAWAGQALDWMPTVQVANYLSEHGDYLWTTESTFDDAEMKMAEDYNKAQAKKLSKEEFKSQVGERKLTESWYDGISQLKTDALIRKYDERRFRDFIFDHSPGGWQKATGMGLMFVMNATDPTNYIPIFGIGSEVNAVGKLFGLGKLVAKYPGLGAIAVNAVDAAIGSALADWYVINRLKAEGENTQFSQLVWDSLMSFGAASLITAGAVGISRVLHGQTPRMDISETPDYSR